MVSKRSRRRNGDDGDDDATTEYAAYAINAFANSVGSGVRNVFERYNVNNIYCYKKLFTNKRGHELALKWK